MMTQNQPEQQYVCDICHNTRSVNSQDEIPVCCDQPMKPLPLDQCTEVHPEMARNEDDSGPCDDGRGQGGEDDPED
ncbi:MAG: hypothetical protein R6U29_01675 [Desulfosudaceae bacterium]